MTSASISEPGNSSQNWPLDHRPISFELFQLKKNTEFLRTQPSHFVMSFRRRRGRLGKGQHQKGEMAGLSTKTGQIRVELAPYSPRNATATKRAFAPLEFSPLRRPRLSKRREAAPDILFWVCFSMYLGSAPTAEMCCPPERSSGYPAEDYRAPWLYLGFCCWLLAS